MAGPLLDRQAKLLEYLTSGRAIFRDKSNVPLDPSLQGIDPEMLHLEARFSHEKRMEKIAAVLATTFGLLGADVDNLVREFADLCPPRDIGRLDNAQQFFDFLSARNKRSPFALPHLLDVAGCELACAEARSRAGVEEQSKTELKDLPRRAIRRHPGIVLLRTAFDIRNVFEGAGNRPPAQRDTPLAIAWISGEPQILELPPEVFELLTALEHWTALAELPGADELIADLAQSGLVEQRA